MIWRIMLIPESVPPPPRTAQFFIYHTQAHPILRLSLTIGVPTATTNEHDPWLNS